MAKKVLNDFSFFDEPGDIIDRVTREHEILEKQKKDDVDNLLGLNINELEAKEIADINLDTVAEYYHKCLFNNKEAQEFLTNKGLNKLDNHSTFKIGYADGSLLEIIGKTQTKELIEAGILNEKGDEVFKGFITIPIIINNNQVIGIHGIDINNKLPVKSIYVNEKNKGLFNPKASKVYDEIILTADILEALSLIELGINNVLSIQGVDSFTGNDLKTLHDNRVKTVALAFCDNLSGADILTDLLVTEGFKIKVISPPKPQKDWNEALLSDVEAQSIKKLIDNAEIFESREAKGKFKVVYENDLYIFTIDNIVYRLAGIKDIFSPNLRIKIRCEAEDKHHRDNLDLYSYRARQNFSNTASGKLDVNTARIEKDLDKILDYFEDEREKKIGFVNVEEKNEMTEEEIKIGIDFLKSPVLIDQTITDINNLGYAGEDNNKLLVYVIGISRFLPKPLSLFALSSPGSGKSYLVDTVLKLSPAERLKYNSSLSDQAFHYMPESDFDGNIFVMGESLHNPIIEGYIRQMQTENMLSRGVVKKDEATGEMKTVNITHKVRLVFMTTSTHLDPDIENISRCILLKIDESVDQTDKVHKRQRYKKTHEGILADRHLIPKIIKKHTLAQRLLKPVMIYNPFAEYIDFPKHKSLLRRSQEHFLITIESICYWRQYQKQIVKKYNPYLKKDEDWIECDYYDYELARRLFIECRLLSGIEEIPDQLDFLYDKIREMLRKKARKENLITEEISFIQTDVREIEGLGIGNESIKRYIRMMVDFEFLQVIGGKRHKVKLSYKLREDKPIKKINVAKIIPTVEQIKAMMEKDKHEN